MDRITGEYTEQAHRVNPSPTETPAARPLIEECQEALRWNRLFKEAGPLPDRDAVRFINRALDNEQTLKTCGLPPVFPEH